jgi:hypothetical protein
VTDSFGFDAAFEDAFEQELDGCEHEFERTLLRVSRSGRLPDEVQRFAGETCAFVAVGDDIQAQTLQPNIHKWLIIVRESENRESVIAHEIAHAFLGHTRGAEFPPDEESRIESEARTLVRAWGFTGKGADEPTSGSG